MIITFEGGEGVGKSTHSKLLRKHLELKGLPVLSFREPGGSSFSELLRELFFHEGLDALTELLMVLASRRENITKLIEPALADGRVVIIDRFVDSTLVYQGVLGGIGVERTRAIMEATGTWLEPDFTFVLDVEPGRSLARITPADKFETREIGFHQRLRQAFLDLAQEKRHVVVNADRPRDEVSRDITAAADDFIDSRTSPAR
ncbi:MAG TPA: dTMP kinase [Deltaproteobacteria bacterium]|nr:dTMP kinase [Deltaproteobacteria bacterium]HOI06457.1 dTMP kinase [Deltaproteobacteria bacterium]